MGTTCEVNVDECSSFPCIQGSCLDHIDGYTCLCDEGFRGIHCETDQDECISAPCLNNGTCADKPRGYTCQCPVGFNGTNCEVGCSRFVMIFQLIYYVENNMVRRVCLSRHIIFDLKFLQNQIYRCLGLFLCRFGTIWGFTFWFAIEFDMIRLVSNVACNWSWYSYFIPYQQVDIDDCFNSECENNATCIDEVAGYHCRCPPGYTGIQCQLQVIPACSSHPCTNGGSCMEDGNVGFRCACLEGFTGEACDRNVDDCVNNGCENGATCLDQVWLKCKAQGKSRRF